MKSHCSFPIVGETRKMGVYFTFSLEMKNEKRNMDTRVPYFHSQWKMKKMNN